MRGVEDNLLIFVLEFQASRSDNFFRFLLRLGSQLLQQTSPVELSRGTANLCHFVIEEVVFVDAALDHVAAMRENGVDGEMLTLLTNQNDLDECVAVVVAVAIAVRRRQRSPPVPSRCAPTTIRAAAVSAAGPRFPPFSSCACLLAQPLRAPARLESLPPHPAGE